MTTKTKAERIKELEDWRDSLVRSFTKTIQFYNAGLLTPSGSWGESKVAEFKSKIERIKRTAKDRIAEIEAEDE